jgi:hypothetical protein
MYGSNPVMLQTHLVKLKPGSAQNTTGSCRVKKNKILFFINPAQAYGNTENIYNSYSIDIVPETKQYKDCNKM